jgi:hypothetical protein
MPSQQKINLNSQTGNSIVFIQAKPYKEKINKERERILKEQETINEERYCLNWGCEQIFK